VAVNFKVVEILPFILDNPRIDLNQADKHGVSFKVFLRSFTSRYGPRMKNYGDRCLNAMMLIRQLRQKREFVCFELDPSSPCLS
jgi:hypothetical protein